MKIQRFTTLKENFIDSMSDQRHWYFENINEIYVTSSSIVWNKHLGVWQLTIEYMEE